MLFRSSSIAEVDVAISSITETIKAAKKKADVEIMPEVMRLFPDLELLIKEKKRVRKRWQRLRQDRDKAELNRLTNKIHKITRNHRSNAFEKDIMDAMDNDNSVWKIGRRLKSSKNSENRPIHGATGLKYDALEKANAIAESLEDQFRTHEPDDDYLTHYRKVRRSVRNFEHTLHQSECLDFTSSETRRLIGQLKVNKSPVQTESPMRQSNNCQITY